MDLTVPPNCTTLNLLSNSSNNLNQFNKVVTSSIILARIIIGKSMNRKLFYLKRNLYKGLFGALVCVASSTVNAEIIFHNGYQLDNESNVIRDPYGLEWLRWSETSNIKDLYETYLGYTSDGWQLATNFQMSRLFNDFNFGIEFDEDPSTTQYLRINDGPIEDLNSPTWIFLELFGSTVTGGYVYSDEETGRYEEVSDKIGITAMFGDDYTDRYQYLNTATVSDDYFFHYKYSDGGETIDTEGFFDGVVGLYSASGADLFGENNTSFAFVRKSSTTEVPEPRGC